MSDLINCPECKNDWPPDRFNGVHPECFKCRVSGLGIAFQGGKEYFHGATTKERQTKAISEARANGYDPVPAWTKTDYAGPVGSFKKLESAVAPKTSKETVGVG